MTKELKPAQRKRLIKLRNGLAALPDDYKKHFDMSNFVINNSEYARNPTPGLKVGDWITINAGPPNVWRRFKFIFTSRLAFYKSAPFLKRVKLFFTREYEPVDRCIVTKVSASTIDVIKER